MSQIIQLHLFDNKYCGHCRLTKDLCEFAMRKRSPDGKAIWCKTCHKEYGRQWHIANHEKQLARFHEYRQQHPDYFRQYGRMYYVKNKDRLNAYNRNAHAEDRVNRNNKHRQWRRMNRAKCNEIWQRRRARLKKVDGRHTADEWMALREWFGNACLCCGTHDDLTADHVIPLVKGGSNDIANLQPLCRVCNSTKHDKEIDYRDPDQLEAFFSFTSSEAYSCPSLRAGTGRLVRGRT